MKIDIISIAKKEKTIYDPLYKDLKKMISRFAKVEEIEIFPKSVAKAHTVSKEASKEAYTKVLEPYINKDYSITLHPEGDIIDSYEFSKLLNDKIAIKFFIGGAYGLENEFLNKSAFCIPAVFAKPVSVAPGRSAVTVTLVSLSSSVKALEKEVT